ncbi:MAG: hypothetical protein NTZ04_07230 [Chloroflexi bacterium]|nr:hypothetical protein [Chloroflexota bacterium]
MSYDRVILSAAKNLDCYVDLRHQPVGTVRGGEPGATDRVPTLGKWPRKWIGMLRKAWAISLIRELPSMPRAISYGRVILSAAKNLDCYDGLCHQVLAEKSRRR